jgi:hypothetical protein
MKINALTQIPQRYLALNWPIRYSSLSSDGRLIGIAGRRGLIHYSSTSGRWKLFANEEQEQNFTVRGGLIWFHHVLVAAVEIAKSYQVLFRFLCDRSQTDYVAQQDSFILTRHGVNEPEYSPP